MSTRSILKQLLDSFFFEIAFYVFVFNCGNWKPLHTNKALSLFRVKEGGGPIYKSEVDINIHSTWSIHDMGIESICWPWYICGDWALKHRGWLFYPQYGVLGGPKSRSMVSPNYHPSFTDHTSYVRKTSGWSLGPPKVGKQSCGLSSSETGHEVKT